MPIKFHFITWLMIAFFPFSGNSQKKLFTNGELPTEHVYRILQDHKGYIWILTEEGIVKYNGTDTKNFTVKDGLPTNDVFNGYFTEDNKFWYDCKGQELGYILNDSVYSFNIGVLKSNQYFIYQKNYVEYYGIYCARIYFENNRWRTTQLDSSFLKKDEIPINNEVITRSKIINSNTLLLYPKTIDTVISIPNFNSISLLPNVAYNTFNDFLVLRDKTKFYFVNTTNFTIKEISIPEINNGYCNLNFVNNRFQITGKNFVILLDEKINIDKHYQFNKKYNAHANLIDKDGNVWLGSESFGVHVIYKDELASELKNKEKNIKQLIYFENDIMYSSEKEIYYFNKNSVYYSNEQMRTSINLLDGKPIIALQHIYQYKGTLKSSLNSKSATVPFAYTNFMFTRTLSLDNTFYLLSKKGIKIFDSNNNSIIKDEYKDINDFIFYQGKILVATNNGVFENQSSEPFFNFTKPTTCLSKNNNDLYLGTNGFGVSVYSEGIQKQHLIKYLIINSIKIYHDSLVFCSTNQGLVCLVNRDDSLRPYYIYDEKDGLINTHLNACEIDKKGFVYIASKNGILKTKLKLPSDINYEPYPILIDYIKWNNDLVSDSTLCFTQENNSELIVKFSAIKFDKTKFYYKLNENNYIETKDGKITTNSLIPGKYNLTFKLETPYSFQQTKTIEFEIKPKWYNTKWFAFLIFLLVSLSSLFLIIRFRKKKIDKTIVELTNQAEISNYRLHALRSQMNPHFVFNSLNSIQYYISENKNEISEKYLVKFSKLIRKFFELSVQKEISISDEVELLTNYLEIEKMRFEEKLNYHIVVDPNLDQNKLIPTMILQPIVENSVNHGVFHKEGKGTIEIKFNKKSEDETEITISDDGVGIENSKLLKANSLANHLSKSTKIFEERINLLNNSAEWKITYFIENLSDDKIYPGTKTVLTIETTNL